MVGEKDVGLVVKFYPPFIVWPPGQRIGGIGFTRSVDEFEVVFLEELFPMGLLMREVLGFVEIGEVLVVGKDFKCMGGTKEVVSPFSKGADDSGHFQVGSVVVSFSIGKGFGDVGDRVPPIILFLGENCTDSNARAIGFNTKWIIDGRHGESRGGGDGSFETFKSRLAIISPFEFIFLGGKHIKRTCDL